MRGVDTATHDNCELLAIGYNILIGISKVTLTPPERQNVTTGGTSRSRMHNHCGEVDLAESRAAS